MLCHGHGMGDVQGAPLPGAPAPGAWQLPAFQAHALCHSAQPPFAHERSSPRQAFSFALPVHPAQGGSTALEVHRHFTGPRALGGCAPGGSMLLARPVLAHVVSP